MRGAAVRTVLAVFCMLMLFCIVSAISVCAAETEPPTGTDKLYDGLPDEAKELLSDLGIESADTKALSSVSVSSVMKQILSLAGQQGGGIMASTGMIAAVLMIYSLFSGIFDNYTCTMLREVLSVVTALCLACALVVPVSSLIDSAINAITVSSDFMLAYIPVMTAVLVSCGQSVSGSGYYALMTAAAQCVAQLSSKILSPLLGVFLAVTVSGAVVPQINLSGLTSMLAKVIKWALSFSFTIFSALLTFRTLISTSVDSVSTRAVRYTLSSFIPVVGAALSEAYKTVNSSVHLLKSGVGIFVIFAVCAVFLPIIVKLLLWLLSVNLCKCISEITGLSVPEQMLSGVSTVLSVLIAIVLCIMALFVISTALIIVVGGRGA